MDFAKVSWTANQDASCTKLSLAYMPTPGATIHTIHKCEMIRFWMALGPLQCRRLLRGFMPLFECLTVASAR
jgi:hypothetical protein